MNRYPVQVRADRDALPSRWLWLVKWLLLIPHYLVLAVLWVAFVALTLIAYVAVLFTGRYPHAIFMFNVGVLRWTWRVGYYGYQVLGTDRYPPFTLAEVPGYPAGLHIDGPPHPPRWLPLLAWLFAVPHALIVAGLSGGAWQVSGPDESTVSVPLGVVSVGVLVVAISLAVRGAPPRGLSDLLVGVARWSLRVTAYVALLTDRYPPFRLDQGGTEPDGDPVGPADRPDPAAAAQPPPAAWTAEPPAATGPTNRTGMAGRVLALVVGVLLLLVAVGIGIGGGAVLALNANRDGAGYVTSQPLDLTSPTAAVTAEGIEIQTNAGWPRAIVDYGRVRITASTPTDTSMFIGVASQSEVDAWLAGTAHDHLIEPYGNDNARYRRAAGQLRDVTTPAEQSFWLATASGTGTVVLDWPAANGTFAVVLANSDGSQNISAQTRIATRIPDLSPLGWGLLGGGLLLAAGAFALIYLGAAGLARRHAGPPPPGAMRATPAPSGPPPTGPIPTPTPSTAPPSAAPQPPPTTAPKAAVEASRGGAA